MDANFGNNRVNKRDPAQLTLFMIWAAQLVVPVILAAMGVFAIERDPRSLGSLEQTLTFAALVMTATAWFIPKLIARSQMKILKEPIRDVGTLMKLVTPAFVVRWAVLEGIAIMGYLMMSMGSPFKRVIPLFAVSLLGILMNRPTPEKAKSLLQ